MFTLITTLRYLRDRYGRQGDRGETGPLGYAFMVSAIVLIAVMVAAWGEDVARFFMDEITGSGAPGAPAEGE